MESNRHHGKRRTPSFGRSVAMYAAFIAVLTAIALVSAISGGPTLPDAALAHASAPPRNHVNIETLRDDPSLPSAAEALKRDAPAAAPAEAAAPTF